MGMMKPLPLALYAELDASRMIALEIIIARLDAAVIENWAGDRNECIYCHSAIMIGDRNENGLYECACDHLLNCIYLEAIKRRAERDYNNIETIETNLDKNGEPMNDMEKVPKEEAGRRMRLFMEINQLDKVIPFNDRRKGRADDV